VRIPHITSKEDQDMSKRSIFMGALAAALAALVIAGCGGGSGGTSGSGSGGAENASATTGGGTISATEIEGLGSVLVDSEGMTVYEYTPDSGTTSNCYGECETAWPPVLAEGKPTAGEGAMSSALGTTKRKDGTTQVTYEGHPVYTFTGDSSPGEANGQELEGTWFALNESGAPVEGKATAPAESEEAEESGGGAYGY
jgi:predicted lipoprotein with Yx(FWY)xxD motif